LRKAAFVEMSPMVDGEQTLDTTTVKPILPTLAKLHRPFAHFAYALLRLSAGAILIPHGVQELLFRGNAPPGRYLLAWGLKEPLEGAWALALLEAIGGVMLALGLLSRPVALVLAAEMAWATTVHLKLGWTWTTAEYPALLLVLCVAVFFRGGGRYSLDYRVGREF
jgi:putative oxidoreductase